MVKFRTETAHKTIFLVKAIKILSLSNCYQQKQKETKAMYSKNNSKKFYKYFITYENEFDSHNPGFEFHNLKDAIRFFNDIIKTGTFWLNDELQKGRQWNVCLWKITNDENKLIKTKKFELKLS